MLKIAISTAASGLLRVLIARARVPRDRVLLTNLRSVDWQSLTFVGERHEISLRIAGPHADDVAQRLTHGLEDADFVIPGQIVADISVVRGPNRTADDSTELTIEALTIAD
jgi:wyosine [tRNA(Phe)-imidazoG37] synthetase (radical SAM superfamily)